MASITLKGLDQVKVMLAGLGAQVGEVNRFSQNKMAYQVWGAEKAQMTSDLDRPNPWTINSVAYKKYGVSSAGAPPVEGAAAFMSDEFRENNRVGPDHYLGVQIEGGLTAGPRRSEKKMQTFGWMPRDKVWVPAIGCPLDAYGNVRGSDIRAMLTSLRANPYAIKKTKVPQTYFLIGAPGNQKGVFRLVGSTYVPFIWFVNRAQYRRRFDFYGRANTEINLHYMDYVSKYLDEALKRL